MGCSVPNRLSHENNRGQEQQYQRDSSMEPAKFPIRATSPSGFLEGALRWSRCSYSLGSMRYMRPLTLHLK
jgi:hypothetical protein